MGDPYHPELYRWALGALTITILLAWYLGLRHRIGPESLAIGALLWPTALGVVSAWPLPAMSYYGSLAAAAAGAGALIAILIRDRRFAWSVVALTAEAVPGTVLLIMGGITLVGVLGIANGAAGVFFFVLAGLLILPLLELALQAPRGWISRPITPLTLSSSAGRSAHDRRHRSQQIGRPSIDHRGAQWRPPRDHR